MFLSFSLSTLFWNIQTAKRFLQIFHELLPRTPVTIEGLFIGHTDEGFSQYSVTLIVTDASGQHLFNVCNSRRVSNLFSKL